MGRRDDPGAARLPFYLTASLLVTGLIAILVAGCARELPQSTIDPVAEDFGGLIHGIYVTIFWWTLLIFGVVWGLLAFIVIRFRERPDRPEPRQTRGNLPLEIGWTLGPAVIVVLIAIPTIRAVFRTQAPAPEDALTVDVVGHQWWWEFRYPEQEVITANELHLPVGRPVELRLSSADVIHSFWVPRIGGKRDVNPRVRQADGGAPEPTRLTFTIDEPGIYQGQCAEFCGLSHALMRMRVIAEMPQEFEAWLRRMKEPAAPEPGSLAARGEDVFLSHACVACHTIAGTRAQGKIGPDLTRLGLRTTIGAGILENTAENLRRWIGDPTAFKPGIIMPAAPDVGGAPPPGLTPEELDAVVAYLASLE